jgi:hypothetical protein
VPAWPGSSGGAAVASTGSNQCRRIVFRGVTSGSTVTGRCAGKSGRQSYRAVGLRRLRWA